MGTRQQSPSYGEIEIGERRWRWTTIGHIRGGEPEGARPTTRWSVGFRDAADPSRRFWYPIPAKAIEHLTDQRLREIFDQARSDA